MNFTGGRILGSMCSAPHPLAAEVYVRYMEKNIGDPGLFPALMELEKEAIRLIGGFLSHPWAAGRIVTGGTEANLMALWTARRIEGGDKNEVIVPQSAHFSFDKAASLMGLKLVKIPLNEDFRVNTGLVRKAVGKRTLALVGIAGSTGLGVTDDIETLSSIAMENNIFLHIDASFGGFVLPFLKDAGYPAPAFDFSLPGVSSIAIDPHKMGRGPIPSGCILYRNAELAETVNIPVKYLSGGKTRINTLVGTRSGAAAASVWAVVKHLGREGYTRIVKQAMDLTGFAVERIKALKKAVPVIERPAMNVVGLRPLPMSADRLAVRLRERGWALSQWDTYLRIVVMPHVTEVMLLDFFKDLQEILTHE